MRDRRRPPRITPTARRLWWFAGGIAVVFVATIAIRL
jgi:hypothetical protein